MVWTKEGPMHSMGRFLSSERSEDTGREADQIRHEVPDYRHTKYGYVPLK